MREDISHREQTERSLDRLAEEAEQLAAALGRCPDGLPETIYFRWRETLQRLAQLGAAATGARPEP